MDFCFQLPDVDGVYYNRKMIVNVYGLQGQNPERYSFKETEVVVGRNPTTDSAVTINSHTISRNHLRARLRNNGIEVQDLGSSNGTVVNDIQLTPKTWHSLKLHDMVKLAEYEGYVQFQVRESTIASQSNPPLTKTTKDAGSSSSESSHSRSREKEVELPFKISESTFRMLKDMTINKKSKEERVKFLRLMGISKAQEYWQQIEKLLKQKKGMREKQETNDNLERLFNQGRSGGEKRGLGR